MKRFLAIALLVLFVGTAHAEIRYEVVDLLDEFDAFTGGPDVVGYWEITAMNNSGQICGYWYSDVDFSSSAFIYSLEDGFVDLSSVVGNGAAWDINDHGQVVGRANLFDDRNYRTFIWDPSGGVRVLEELEGSPLRSSINNIGQVAAVLCRGEITATCLWEDGAVVDIGHLGGDWTSAHGLNNSGEIIGLSALPRGEPSSSLELRPFRWTRDDGMTEVRSSAGSVSVRAINDLGDMCGHCVYDGTAHAVVWVDGEPANIDTLGFSNSTASAVNNIGQMIGSGDYPRPLPDGTFYDEQIAFYWDSEIGMCFLEDLLQDDVDWHILYASVINDQGWIFVDARTDPPGRLHPLLLRPVPEPSGILLLYVASAALCVSRRRRTSSPEGK